jgi:hypothetical protein
MGDKQRLPLLIVALLSVLDGCQRGDKLDTVVTRNTEAAGGSAAIESVQSIQVDLHIVDPGFEVDGVYRAARPGRMRIDITADQKHVYTEAFNGHRGWQCKGEGPMVDEKPEATATLRHGTELPGKLFGLHEMTGRGHQLEFAGRQSVAGTNYYVIRLKMNDGYSTSLYIDPANWLVTRRRDFRPLHVDIDPRPTTIETLFSDFREVNGVRFPFRTIDTDLQTGKVLETARITKIIVNPTIDHTIFDKL